MKYINKTGLNSNHLKMIAIIAMTVDHFADLFFPNFPCKPVPLVLHFIGRLTAPIMWFFIFEGFYYTRDIKKYMLRLGVFAIVSHFAYCFGFGINPVPFYDGTDSVTLFNQTSVMYPLFVSVVVLWLNKRVEGINSILKFAATFILIWSAFPADWSCIAVLAIIGMYEYRGNLNKQMIAMSAAVIVYGIVSWFFVSRVYAVELVGVLMIYPLLKNYNGERGKAKWMKWFFYLFYPLHLVILGILRIAMYGNTNICL